MAFHGRQYDIPLSALPVICTCLLQWKVTLVACLWCCVLC